MKERVCCSCGFPQSYPMPHTHDLTDREKTIIKTLKDKFRWRLEQICFRLDDTHPSLFRQRCKKELTKLLKECELNEV